MAFATMGRSMPNLLRAPALGAFFVAAALAVTGCGDAVPGNSVVKVEETDASITRDTFNRWMNVAVSQNQPEQANAPKPQVPKPPEFAACVTQKRKTTPKPAKGQPAPSSGQLKTQCKTEYEGLRDTVLSFLIAAEWVEGESVDQKVKVKAADVDKSFAQRKKSQFPKEADFQKFLKQTGFRVEDIKFQVRVEELQRKLVAKITKGTDKVTDAQISAYYTKQRKQFAQPERRDLRIVLTKTRARAAAAKQALAGGQSFKSVAKRYSIDQASKDQGGQLLAVAKGQQEKAFDAAIFKARRGSRQGPVKTEFGYYVFEVAKITPASQQTLAQAKPTIKTLLAQQNQQKALDKFVKTYRAKWKKRTNCRKGFVTADCKNGPKQAATQPGAGQQQQPAQPQQQQPAQPTPPQEQP